MFSDASPSHAPSSLLCRGMQALALLCALWQPVCVGAAPLPQESGTYAYYADNTTVSKVLTDFCADIGLQLRMPPGITARITGRLSAGSRSEFLDAVAAAHGLNWFYYAGALYVSTLADWSIRTLPVSRESIGALKQALAELGILDRRFGWADIAEQGVVLVSGPQSYLDLIVATTQSLQLAPRGQQIAMFRLRYANVDDRVITVRDQQLIIPGVATVLRKLVEVQQQGVSETTRKPSGVVTPAAPPSLPLLPPATGDNTAVPILPPSSKVETTESAPRAIAATGRAATIQSDTRLNAILIKDSPEAFPMYQKLIASLDIPAKLVEIEAMTIDVNKSSLRDLGIDWSLGARGITLTRGTPGDGADAGTLSVGYHAELTTIIGNQAAAFLARIQALENRGDARVIGKPSILTTDNLRALIDLSQTYYAKAVGERVANIIPVTTGVTLNVTPRVIPQEPGQPAEIQLVIDIEDGALVDRSVDNLPIVQRSTISTQAVIQENQSLLIGGYDTRTESQQQGRIPVLADLPMVGALFRNSQSEIQARTRLFLITPRIIDSEQRAAGAQRALSMALPAPAGTPPLFRLSTTLSTKW